MPRGDGTGPAGAGPMSGRAAGFCVGFQTPGFANRPAAFGYGFGRGRGFHCHPRLGLAHRWGTWDGGFAVPQRTPVQNGVDEKQALENHAAVLRDQLEAVQRRLDQLDQKSTTE